MKSTLKAELDSTNRLITYRWLPNPTTPLREHYYSSVFPALSASTLAREARRNESTPSNSLVVIANGEIVAGRQRLEICFVTDEPATVLDLGRVSTEVVRRYVTAVNSRRNDISRDEKQLAAETLFSISQGSLTRQEAEAICGLSTHVW